MNVKDIIKKLRNKEELTAEEAAFLDAYDPDMQINTAAAAARRDAEEKLKKAVADLEAANTAKTDLESKVGELNKTLQNRAAIQNEAFKEVSEKVALLEKENKEAREEAARVKRDNRINTVISKAGITYSDSVDKGVINDDLFKKIEMLGEDGLKALEDAENPEKNSAYGHVFAKHRERWKGAIVDQSGSGSGSTPPGSKTPAIDSKVNPWMKDTRNLTRQLEISIENPELATRMKADAGIEQQE